MARRYLFGPVSMEFAEQNLRGPRERGECLAFDSSEPADGIIRPGDSWEAIVSRLPSGWQPDFIALYLGFELMSLALYVVAAINRDSVRSTEAGLKYFVLGALSSGMLLYGASLIYGFTGTVSFAGIANAASQGSAGTASLGLVFLVFLMKRSVAATSP